MKVSRIAVMMIVAIALGACSREDRDSITSPYANDLLTGQVVMSGGRNASPAGVRVSVRGTGMTVTLTDDGQFAFAGAPKVADLDFMRDADGIQASVRLEDTSEFVVIELARSNARKSSKRRTIGKTREKTFEFEGVIRSATPESIVVFTSKKEEVTIALAPDTVIRHGNRVLTPADLLVDTRVHVKARLVADAYSAISVWVQEGDDDGGDDEPAEVREYEGIVVSATATELVVYTSKKQEETFVMTPATEVRKGNTPVAPETILPGTRVHVKAAEGTDGTKTAVRVTIQNTNVAANFEGVVASLGTSSLVVMTAEGEQTVNVTSSTQIRKNGKKITLAEVAVGSTVAVEGTRVDATTVSAKKISVT